MFFHTCKTSVALNFLVLQFARTLGQNKLYSLKNIKKMRLKNKCNKIQALFGVK